MPKVFISYRREDSIDIVGRIYDSLVLVHHFKREEIFLDVDSIPYGADFRKFVEGAIVQSTVMLVVIGQKWLSAADANGNRRLDDPNDFVRTEIEVAMQHNIPIIPVLVQNAPMPPSSQLPEPFANMAYLNAKSVRSGPDFSHDMEDVAKAIDSFSSSVLSATPASPKRREKQASIVQQPKPAATIAAAPANPSSWLTSVRIWYASLPAATSSVRIVALLGFIVAFFGFIIVYDTRFDQFLSPFRVNSILLYIIIFSLSVCLAVYGLFLFAFSWLRNHSIRFLRLSGILELIFMAPAIIMIENGYFRSNSDSIIYLTIALFVVTAPLIFLSIFIIKIYYRIRYYYLIAVLPGLIGIWTYFLPPYGSEIDFNNAPLFRDYFSFASNIISLLAFVLLISSSVILMIKLSKLVSMILLISIVQGCLELFFTIYAFAFEDTLKNILVINVIILIGTIILTKRIYDHFRVIS